MIYMHKTRKKTIRKINSPRLSIYKSNKNLYIQLIDDSNNHTLVGKGTLSKNINSSNNLNNLDKYYAITDYICNIAKSKNVYTFFIPLKKTKIRGNMYKIINRIKLNNIIC